MRRGHCGHNFPTHYRASVLQAKLPPGGGGGWKESCASLRLLTRPSCLTLPSGWTQPDSSLCLATASHCLAASHRLPAAAHCLPVAHTALQSLSSDLVAVFRVILTEPERGLKFDETTDGGAERCIAIVTIQCDDVVKNNVDKVREFEVRWVYTLLLQPLVLKDSPDHIAGSRCL